MGEWEITVLSATPDATDIVLAENQFNEPPADGRQFHLVEIAAKYLGTDSESPALGLTFSAVGTSSVAYDYEAPCGVVPDEFPDFTEVFGGGTVSGNLCWSIRTEDADSLLLIADAAFSFDDERIFFEIPPEGVVFDPPSSTGAAANETTPGSRGNPIAVGETATIGDWEVTVLSAMSDATDLVLAENQFNEPPADGRQFYLVEVETTYRGEDSEAPALGLSFSAVGESSVAYDYEDTCGVIPDELPEYTEVFTDGTVSGYLCWSVASTDVGSLVMIVDAALSFDDERLFFEIPD